MKSNHLPHPVAHYPIIHCKCCQAWHECGQTGGNHCWTPTREECSIGLESPGGCTKGWCELLLAARNDFHMSIMKSCRLNSFKTHQSAMWISPSKSLRFYFLTSGVKEMFSMVTTLIFVPFLLDRTIPKHKEEIPNWFLWGCIQFHLRYIWRLLGCS